MSNTLLPAKAREISARGLMSYPTDSPDDTVRIEAIAALLACTTQPVRLRLPRSKVEVSFDPTLPPHLLYLLTVGDYEQGDLDIAAEYVTAGERVMEIGCGIGVTGCALARASGEPAILVEANPHLWPHIKTNFDLNGLRMTLVEGAAVPSHYEQDTVTLHVQPNYWWSSLTAREGSQAQDVAAFKLTDLVARYRPTTLVLDIEGAEVFLLTETLADCVKKVIAEIHTPTLGTQLTAAIIARLADSGFRARDMRFLTWVFTRT